MTGAIAKGYCAPQWDFTVEAAATPRRSRSSLVPCGQKFDSERWRLLTGFRPAGCAVSTANGRGFRSAPGVVSPQRGRISTSRPCPGGTPLRAFAVPLLRRPAEARWIMAEKETTPAQRGRRRRPSATRNGRRGPARCRRRLDGCMLMPAEELMRATSASKEDAWTVIGALLDASRHGCVCRRRLGRGPTGRLLNKLVKMESWRSCRVETPAQDKREES